MMLGATGGRWAGSNFNGAGMAWLPQFAARQTPSVSNHGTEADSYGRESSVPMELNNSEGE